MSGMFMMHRQGEDPEDSSTTTFVSGLERLHRRSMVQTGISALATALSAAAATGILWGRVRWYECMIIVGLYVTVAFNAASAGITMGRWATFNDLSKAKVKVEQVRLDDD